MKLFGQFFRYMNPSIWQKIRRDMDRRSLRNIYIMSLIVLFFEAVSLILN